MLLRCILFMIAGALFAQPPANDLPLMPWPAKVERTTGQFIIDGNLKATITGAGASDVRVNLGVERMLQRLYRQTGIPRNPASNSVDDGTVPALLVVVENKGSGDKSPIQLGEDESYRLTITADRLRLSANEPMGILRGLETFLQLVRVGPNGFAAPAVDITDQPRFVWRGLSLDVSRHFIPIDAIKRTLDGLAAVKMNVFHWHLSDDQGFRVESKRYPKLHQMGSDGMYYTQSEIKDIVAYARLRGVRVVPEFDIPGHTSSWFPGYPNLASGKGPYRIERLGGVIAATMDPTKESTYKFLDGFIGEMKGLFPDTYFHVGGDEVWHKGEWANNARIAAFMKKNKLADLDALQAYFNRRLLRILSKHGKRMVGWDEILHADLPKNSVIQSWRGRKSLADAARQGYSGILSNGYYLDLMQPASQHYAVDPLSGDNDSLTAAQRARILGGEAAMWEEIASEENIDVKLWPRLAAIAERLWSPASLNDIDSMYRRLAFTSTWLDQQGLHHLEQVRLMQSRLVNNGDAMLLAQFAAVLEPLKGYARHRARKYNSFTPLNRLVDAVPPESDIARQFREAVSRYLKGGNGAENLRAQLTNWQRTAAAIQPVLNGNALLQEHMETAAALERISAIGVEALDSKTRNARPDAASVQALLNQITEAAKPKADVLIQIAPGVQALVEALRAPQ